MNIGDAVRDLFALPGTRLKQWVVDVRRERAWEHRTCPRVLTSVHNDNTGLKCRNSGEVSWADLDSHDCCHECNDLAGMTVDRADVAAWLALKVERPLICADREQLSDEVAS